MARYCDKGCQRRGWKCHKGEVCRKMAVLKFSQMIEQLAGPDQDCNQWALATMDNVINSRTLPSGVSLRQIDDLAALLPTALSYMPPGSEYVVRQAQAWLTVGWRAEAIAELEKYAQGFLSGGYEWRVRGCRRDAGLRPLELLRDLIDDDSGKQAVMNLIQITQDEEERLRVEALEEVRAEQRGRPRKPRKRTKKRRKKKASARTVEAAMAGLQVGESAEGGGGGGLEDPQLEGKSGGSGLGQQKPQEEEEEQQLCSICLGELDADDDDVDVGDLPDMLVCRHVYHTSCLDRWACKCAEKNVEPTCPECRGPLQRLT